MSPQQGDEPDGSDVTTFQPTLFLGHHHQHLLIPIAQWYQETPTLGKLLREGVGNGRSTGAYQDGVEWGEFAPPQGAVTKQGGHISHTQFAEQSPCAIQQRAYPFYREHLACKVRQEDGCKANTS